MKVPFGIDPDETFELDFCAALGRFEIDGMKARLDALRGNAATAPSKIAEVEAAFAKAEAELAAYAPGTGPIFVCGHIPNAKRAEISGESLELGRAAIGVESEKRTREWAEMVVRWSVRGHHNLTRRDGTPAPFEAVDEQWLGETRKVVSRKTLESYQTFIDDLALLILRAQRLGEAGKNG